MDFSLRDLSYFLAVVAHGHLGHAASACAVTQPALSKSLKRLEDETGLALFDRAGRAIRPTSAGLAFAEHARKVVNQYDDAVRHAEGLRAGGGGLLRLGATAATMDTVVMPALEALLPAQPGLRVVLTLGLSDELPDLVERGDLDLAVAPSDGTRGGVLRQDAMGHDVLRLVAGRRNPLFKRAALGLADLAEQRWILPKRTSVARQRLDASFARADQPLPRAVLEVDFISAGALKLVAGTDLLTVAPASLLEDNAEAGVAALPVEASLPLKRDISLLSRRQAVWSPMMKAFRAVLRNRS
ncbi:LysR family transcriptional regulator [Bordetella bronchialis]|uniref:LysR family transcriptional regulator n=1 Tax=Bordetella bronchialis TaxID=463025 RepID=A0A193FMX9_9BORD|nr:LysR family transcriptional regulator [Bordetella bronchialis]ANN68454.1 LysR family transcriptional regulator [Bordetella bronchialis]ANN73596.1 LysR family transcriptional regulator [Bordetella bronchialis]